jgi:hypothetical protein
MKLVELDKGAVALTAASESDNAALLQRHSQNSLHLENGTYYSPTQKGTLTSTPRSSGKGWLGRLFQYKDPGSASYHHVGDEELAPLHRLHDRGDGDDEEDGLGSTEFEVVDGAGDVRQ